MALAAVLERGVHLIAINWRAGKPASAIVFSILFIFAGITQPGFARGGPQLEELVVYAQKREENLLHVPMSLSVLTAEEMREMATFSFADLEDLTPGVEFNAGLQTAAIRLRGVGPGAFALNAPQSVAVFVDQFAQAQVGTVFGSMFDVQRVELLRGPQGMLYGLNAPGGVYSITTHKPDVAAFGGYLRGSYSQFNEDSDRSSHDLRGAVNVPLIKNELAWRIAGVYREQDGFVTMEHPDATHKAAGGGKTQSARSRVLWNIDDSKQLYWTLNYGDFERQPVATNFEGQIPGSGGMGNTPAVSSSFKYREYWGSYRSNVQADLRDTSLHFVWDTAGPQLDLLGSYQSFNNSSLLNRAPYFGGDSTLMFDFEYEVKTLEFRASGEGTSVDYIAGLHYNDRPVNADLTLAAGQAPRAGAGSTSTESYSAFAGVNLHWMESWALALGVRYDASEADVDFRTRYAGLIEGNLEDSSSFDHLTWSAKLRWYIDAQTMAYAAADTAFKQGGYNVLVLPGTTVAQTFPLVAEAALDAVEYDKETSEAFEIGIKGKALDNRIRYSIAIYHQSFQDHQLTHSAPNIALAPLGGLFSSTITNAERVTTRGVEASLTYVIDKRWRVSHRAAYSDPDIEKWTQRYCQGGEVIDERQVYCASINEPLNNSPKWKANTQLRYQRPLRSGKLYSRLSWTWVSQVSSTGVTDEFRENENRLGFTLGWRSKSEGIDLRLWAKNLTDEDGNQNPGQQSNGDATQPAAYKGGYSRGRELGVGVGYRF